MIITVLGFIANLTSFILWIPQAITTFKNKNNPTALVGISYITQILVIINTLAWCWYGIISNDFWIAIGTIIILPLAIFTITIKLMSERSSHE